MHAIHVLSIYPIKAYGVILHSRHSRRSVSYSSFFKRVDAVLMCALSHRLCRVTVRKISFAAAARPAIENAWSNPCIFIFHNPLLILQKLPFLCIFCTFSAFFGGFSAFYFTRNLSFLQECTVYPGRCTINVFAPRLRLVRCRGPAALSVPLRAVK